jgi:hypothetical protein
MVGDAPFRFTKQRWSVEFTLLWFVLVHLWRFTTWGLRRWKPVFYHPVALVGIAISIAICLISPWLLVALIFSGPVLIREWPGAYLRHVQPRIISFFVGFKYRYRPRRKLSACSVLRADDPVPTISRVRKSGCTTKVWIKMAHGHEIDWWREETARLAQTYNAGDCKINPYRRVNFLSFRPDRFLLRPPFIRYHFEEKVTKYRWLELEFLTKDPFAKSVGFEYIDFHRTAEPLQEVGRPVGPKRDGSPYCLLTRTHLLCVAMSGRGKSNAERAMVYAEYEDVLAGYVENWIFDGKRGTEASPMAHCFARVENGKNGPLVVEQFVAEVERVMYRRLDEMAERGENLFVPDPEDEDPLMRRLLRFYIDEIMIFETVPYADVKSKIYKSLAAILLQGRAAGISIRAFAQNPKLDRLPMRDDFPEIQIGGLQNRRQIDTAISGGWDLGAREIPEDLPGVFFVKTEVGMALEQIRYAHDRDNAIQRLDQCPDSVLWPRPIEEQKASVRDEVFMA